MRAALNSAAVLVAAMAAMPLGAAPAAAFQIYTDRTAWEAALAGASITTDGFDNDVAAADSITFDSGVVSAGAPTSASLNNFVGTGRYSGIVDAGASSASESQTYDTITWTFPLEIIAFAADWDPIGTGEPGLTITGNFDGTGDQTISLFVELANPGQGFLGVIGLTPFTSITLSEEGRNGTSAFQGFRVDNLAFAASAPVPEPATLALFGAGLAGLATLRRRRGLDRAA